MQLRLHHAAHSSCSPSHYRSHRCSAVRPIGAPVGLQGASAIQLSPSLRQKPRLTYAGSSSDGMSPDKTQFGERFEGSIPAPAITKDEAHFESMGLEFVNVQEGLALTDLQDLFLKVGFAKRDPDRLKVAIENTYHLIWIRATKQSRLAKLGQLVGFARATSDGVLSATIWDVAVAPAWQRTGLGRALIERLTAKLVNDGIPTITLYAEPSVVGLYEKLGFIRDPEGIKGMAFQRQKKKAAPARRR
uniref:N-acetyltransferase domain-containing protein n=1 Tax=Dunaliella tertiolecta TaxID=3047 RepID=A0A7S3QNU8_DUNTE|mmetsp:Transcript_4355/g.11821  ORF Transcript_4355/g.11821 Transcript_4355/m.11821 type:complete len:246 (+) Transcript_4355:132-869(+)